MPTWAAKTPQSLYWADENTNAEHSSSLALFICTVYLSLNDCTLNSYRLQALFVHGRHEHSTAENTDPIPVKYLLWDSKPLVATNPN